MCIVFLSRRAYFVLFVALIIVVKVITLLKGTVNFVTGYFSERIRNVQCNVYYCAVLTCLLRTITHWLLQFWQIEVYGSRNLRILSLSFTAQVTQTNYRTVLHQVLELRLLQMIKLESKVVINVLAIRYRFAHSCY